MELKLLPMAQTDIKNFKHDIQEAFQKGFEAVYGKTEGTILSEKDIDRSLNAVGSVAYKAVINGEMVAEVSRSKDIIEIKYKYYIIDYYEWGWHAEGNDYEQHMLHECGLAREYPVIGYYESIETWKVGDRYENT